MRNKIFDNPFIGGIFFGIVFFLVGLLTISHYGVNIDEPAHFTRGHAYFYLLLTGKDRYDEKDLEGVRISAFKIKGYDGHYFINHDSGHPPVNGILAAAFNIIFYEKLGIIGDLESYHLFEIFVSSLLVFLVFIIARREFGLFAGIIATLSLALYPLFLGESHFNIKDPIEAAFFAFTVYFFYLGLEKTQGRYFFFSSIFCALAFGTKFNIVFLPFIVIPYLIIRYFPLFPYLKYNKLKKIPATVYISLIAYPAIVLGVHFLTRPYLWSNPIGNFLEVLRYYQVIGEGEVYQPDFIFHGWNTYPVVFVAISTPLIILILCLFGIGSAFLHFLKERKKITSLLFLWFIVPIIRVMWPGTSIYSGVRQIMEYVPAMAILAGIGSAYIVTLFNGYAVRRMKLSGNKHVKQFIKGRTLLLLQIIIIISFLPITLKLISIHPNENVYINPLVGGLRGAVDKKIPGAAESMGNVYLQGIWWLNEHAEKNARYHIPVGLGSNIPRQFERDDIEFGPNFSGMERGGEYMMEMISVDFPPPRYGFQYLNTFLDPVHIVQVDGVPVLKIWKNDLKHTKKGYRDEVDEKNIEVEGGKNKGFIEIRFKELAWVTRLEILHDADNCTSEGSGEVYYSPDAKTLYLSPADLYGMQGPYAKSLQTNSRFVYFFPATAVKSIRIVPVEHEACVLRFKNVYVWKLRNNNP